MQRKFRPPDFYPVQLLDLSIFRSAKYPNGFKCLNLLKKENIPRRLTVGQSLRPSL